MDWPGDLIGIILAIIFGSAIGFERELSGKAAGLRTNVLIALGAAVFTIISREVGGDSHSITRIAAQIVTGDTRMRGAQEDALLIHEYQRAAQDQRVLAQGIEAGCRREHAHPRSAQQ